MTMVSCRSKEAICRCKETISRRKETISRRKDTICHSKETICHSKETIIFWIMATINYPKSLESSSKSATVPKKQMILSREFIASSVIRLCFLSHNLYQCPSPLESSTPKTLFNMSCQWSSPTLDSVTPSKDYKHKWTRDLSNLGFKDISVIIYLN